MSARTDLSGWPAASAAAVATVVGRGQVPSRARVAAELGISPRTMRTRDHRVGIEHVTQLRQAAAMVVSHEHQCHGCGKPLACRAWHHRRWCREACRLAAFRVAHPPQPEQLVCACGAAYPHRQGLGRRPTACPTCRATVLLAKAAARAAAILAVRR